MAEEEKSILAIAQEQFKSTRGELQYVEVPEWENRKVFYYSVPNVDEFIRLSKDISRDESTEAVLTAFMLFARDENGKRLFGEHNRKTIREFFDARVVSRIVGEMGVFANLFADADDEAKNA